MSTPTSTATFDAQLKKKETILGGIKKGLPPLHAAAIAGIPPDDFHAMLTAGGKEARGKTGTDLAGFFKDLERAVLVTEAGLIAKISKGDKGASRLLREMRASCRSLGILRNTR